MPGPLVDAAAPAPRMARAPPPPPLGLVPGLVLELATGSASELPYRVPLSRGLPTRIGRAGTADNPNQWPTAPLEGAAGLHLSRRHTQLRVVSDGARRGQVLLTNYSLNGTHVRPAWDGVTGGRSVRRGEWIRLCGGQEEGFEESLMLDPALQWDISFGRPKTTQSWFALKAAPPAATNTPLARPDPTACATTASAGPASVSVRPASAAPRPAATPAATPATASVSMPARASASAAARPAATPAPSAPATLIPLAPARCAPSSSSGKGGPVAASASWRRPAATRAAPHATPHAAPPPPSAARPAPSQPPATPPPPAPGVSSPSSGKNSFEAAPQNLRKELLTLADHAGAARDWASQRQRSAPLGGVGVPPRPPIADRSASLHSMTSASSAVDPADVADFALFPAAKASGDGAVEGRDGEAGPARRRGAHRVRRVIDESSDDDDDDGDGGGGGGGGGGGNDEVGNTLGDAEATRLATRDHPPSIRPPSAADAEWPPSDERVEAPDFVHGDFALACYRLLLPEEGSVAEMSDLAGSSSYNRLHADEQRLLARWVKVVRLSTNSKYPTYCGPDGHGGVHREVSIKKAIEAARRGGPSTKQGTTIRSAIRSRPVSSGVGRGDGGGAPPGGDGGDDRGGDGEAVAVPAASASDVGAAAAPQPATESEVAVAHGASASYAATPRARSFVMHDDDDDDDDEEEGDDEEAEQWRRQQQQMQERSRSVEKARAEEQAEQAGQAGPAGPAGQAGQAAQAAQEEVMEVDEEDEEEDEVIEGEPEEDEEAVAEAPPQAPPPAPPPAPPASNPRRSSFMIESDEEEDDDDDDGGEFST